MVGAIPIECSRDTVKNGFEARDRILNGTVIKDGKMLVDTVTPEVVVVAEVEQGAIHVQKDMIEF